jgi:hypothetical protein
MAVAGIQISSKIQESDDYDGIWSAFAYISTEVSRKKRSIPAEDEYAMSAVAHALAARVLALESKQAIATRSSGKRHSPSPTPQVGLSAYADFAYVELATMDGTKAQASAALAVLDKAIKAFNASDIGL